MLHQLIILIYVIKLFQFHLCQVHYIAMIYKRCGSTLDAFPAEPRSVGFGHRLWASALGMLGVYTTMNLRSWIYRTMQPIVPWLVPRSFTSLLIYPRSGRSSAMVVPMMATPMVGHQWGQPWRRAASAAHGLLGQKRSSSERSIMVRRSWR